MPEGRLLKIDGRYICSNCKNDISYPVAECPLCGAPFSNVARNEGEYRQKQIAIKNAQKMKKDMETFDFYATILLFIMVAIFIIAIINSLLCIFVYNNFSVNLLFIIGIIIPILYFILYMRYVIDLI